MSPLDDRLLLAFWMGANSQRNKKPKKAKQHFNNWFEKLTHEQLKLLCKAAGVPVSGTKSALAERLCACPLTKDYTDFPPTVSSLQQQCRQQGLIVSGKQFDLILRLLQNQTGKGGQPKRAAGVMDPETGEFRPAKRAKSMVLPSVEKLTLRAFRKAYPDDKVRNKWGKWTGNMHSTRCVEWALHVIEKEVFEKELFARGQDELAWQVIEAVFRWIVFGDRKREKEHMRKQREANMHRVFQPGDAQYVTFLHTAVGFRFASEIMESKAFPMLIRAIRASKASAVVQVGARILRGIEYEYHWGFDEFSKLLEEYGVPKGVSYDV